MAEIDPSNGKFNVSTVMQIDKQAIITAINTMLASTIPVVNAFDINIKS